MSAGVVININIKDVIEWLTAQQVKYPTGEMSIYTISNWLFARLDERLPKSKPEASSEQKLEERLYKTFFPNDDNVLELYNKVVTAINTHSTDDITLLEKDKSYLVVEEKFKVVIDIFVDYFKTLKPTPDEHDFSKFALLFTKRVEQQKESESAMLITGKSFDQTLEYISKIITNIIVNPSRDTLKKITTVFPHEPVRGHGYWGGGRRSRRNSSSTRRRPSRKSSATKPRRRPRRRTSRK